MQTKKSSGIASWPVDDRPREKLLTRGPRSLSNSELLAILIRTGTRGNSAIDLGRQLMEKFKTFRDMAHLDARVGRIASITNEWRDEAYSLVYVLKNRASLASMTKTVSKETDLLEDYLYQFKRLDLDLLKRLVLLMEDMDENDIDQEKVDALSRKLRIDRMKVIDALLNEIDQGRINDEDGVLRREAQAVIQRYKEVHSEKGGIDLNHVHIKRTGHVVQMQFDPVLFDQFNQEDFEGFVPIIINIQNISGTFELLGVN